MPRKVKRSVLSRPQIPSPASKKNHVTPIVPTARSAPLSAAEFLITLETTLLPAVGLETFVATQCRLQPRKYRTQRFVQFCKALGAAMNREHFVALLNCLSARKTHPENITALVNVVAPILYTKYGGKWDLYNQY